MRLAVARTEARYRFAVEDTGIGISAEQLPRIFDTFRQAHGQHDVIEGTGLGLAISKTLVALMGGALDVASAPGAGSRFWFELELTEAPAVQTRPRRPVVGVRGDRRRLLVIDDNADNRQLLRDLLAPIGFEVDEASDAESGLARVAAMPPDAVLIDLRMPGVNGLEGTRRLRALEPRRALAVIAISASVFGHHRDECIAAGADDFLAKPFRLEQLLDVLCRHLSLMPIHDEAPVPAASSPDGPPAALIFPPPEVLGPLLAQAQRGDIRQVLEQAIRIEHGDVRYASFVAELRGLAQRFQVNKLCEFLEKGQAIS